MSEDFDNSQHGAPASVTFRGPANWFSFSLPQTLHLEQTEAFMEIKPVVTSLPAGSTNTQPSSQNSDASSELTPGSSGSPTPLVGGVNATPPGSADWTLTLYSAWVDESEPGTKASSFNAASLFPGVVQSNPGTPLELPGRCQTWVGISRETVKGSWWQRLFAKRRSYEWRLWVIEYCDIIIVASLQGRMGVPIQTATVSKCEEVLNSILFAEVLAKPPALFRAEVIQIARTHFPLLHTEAAGSFSVDIAGSEINLSNFYRSYIQNPERIKEVVLPGLATIVRMQELSPDQLMPELDEVSDRVMPMLYPQSEADTSMKDFVRISWVGGLSVMFVLDEDDSYRFVHKSMLEKWKIDVDELQALALQNLQTFSDEHPLEVSLVGTTDDAQMLVPVKPSPYNSVRLLGEQLHGRLRQILGAELVVGVPNRDFFVAVSLNHPDLIEQIQQRVVQDYQAMHHQLTSRLLVISADGVSEYCES